MIYANSIRVYVHGVIRNLLYYTRDNKSITAKAIALYLPEFNNLRLTRVSDRKDLFETAKLTVERKLKSILGKHSCTMHLLHCKLEECES